MNVAEKGGLSSLARGGWNTLDVMREHGEMSIQELVRGTGLTWSGVIRRVAELKDSGFLMEGAENPKRGEPVKLNPKLGYFVGISILPDGLSGCAVDFAFRSDDQLKRSINEVDSLPKLFRGVREMVSSYLGEIPKEKLLGIGFSFPGFVDSAKGCLRYSPSIPYINDLPIQELMPRDWNAGAIRIPMVIESDIHCATLAEKEMGARGGLRRKQKTLLRVGVEEYLTMGLLADDQLVKGYRGFGGWGSSPNLTFAKASELNQFGEKMAKKLGEEMGRVATLLNPELVVIDGFADALDRFNIDFKFAFWKSCGSYAIRDVSFETSRLGGQAVLLGAAISAHQSLRA